METTRTQSQPVHSSSAMARQKPAQASAGKEGAAQGSFLALLAAVGSDESVASAALAGAGGDASLATAASDEAPADESDGHGAFPDLTQMGMLVPQTCSLPAAIDGSGGPVVAANAGLTQCDAQGAANFLAINANTLGIDSLGVPKAIAQGVLGGGLVAQTVQMDACALAEGNLAPNAAGMPANRFHAATLQKGAAGAWTGAGGFGATQERALGLGGTLATAGSVALAGGNAAASAAGASAGLWAPSQGEQRGVTADLREGGAALAVALEDVVGAVAGAALPARAQDQGQGQSQPQGNMAAAGSEMSAVEGALHPMGEASYEAAMAATEEALSEQVTYWVDQNLQQAKLTVEHDGGAVSVSVALQGNEAHVSLMADQAQARDLLDADQAQLRELLRQQGLDLAGLTVGLSSQRQGAERRGQSSGQPADARGTALPKEAPERTARVSVRVLTDRAVDLFV